MRIALAGTLPPPFGGISIHVKRLQQALAARGVQATVYAQPDLPVGGSDVVPVRRSARWYWERMRRDDFDLLHVHTFETDLKHIVASALLASAGRTVVVTMHSFRDEPITRTRKYTALVGWSLPKYAHVICVGPEIQREVVERGADPARSSVISSYIPPVPNDADRREIPRQVKEFLDTHSPVLCANAYRLAQFDGSDLYGLDMCIEVCRELAPDYPRLGFVFAIGTEAPTAYLNSMLERIEQYGLRSRFCFVMGAVEFWPIIERSSVMLRPTNTDGLGISVAEAIDLGVPAIASDVCERPAGTLLFQNRCLPDLVSKVRRVLSDEAEQRRLLQVGRAGVNAQVDDILCVYRGVLKR